MTWLDGLCLLLLVVLAAVATWLGTVKAVAFLIGAYAGGKISHFLAERSLFIFQGQLTPDTTKAVVFLLAMVFLLFLTIGAGHLISHSVHISEETDHLIAFPIAVLVGITLVHWFVQVLVWFSPQGFGKLLSSSPIANEFLTFATTKMMLGFLRPPR
ncbi:MAG: hypothetical protein NZ959_08740 [Armatimonadetes bacterium]|nr:hypothetical protein [Armatimonadota bacterium]MDW8122557.1 hypothetical protein [Armatimonadota bacterium]